MIATLDDLATLANYSLMDSLSCDPEATASGVDHAPRQVFSGHYVPVKPTPIENPEYVKHSENLFRELGFADSMAQSADFMRVFSGDIESVSEPMRKVGWACGYALSIYGNEYYQQCPFQTGNGYGDGRAISVLEAVISGQRWEMQLKGGGRRAHAILPRRGRPGRSEVERARVPSAGTHARAWGANISLAEFVRVENREGQAAVVFGGLTFNGSGYADIGTRRHLDARRTVVHSARSTRAVQSSCSQERTPESDGGAGEDCVASDRS